MDAPSALARTLDQELQAQVTRQGLEGVMGPSEARKQLRGQIDASFRVSMTVARRQIDEAEQHTLFMRRSEAVGNARAAITSLQVLDCTLLYPQLMAQAHEALALALLLQPEDDKGAVEAFRRALDADLLRAEPQPPHEQGAATGPAGPAALAQGPDPRGR